MRGLDGLAARVSRLEPEDERRDRHARQREQENEMPPSPPEQAKIGSLSNHTRLDIRGGELLAARALSQYWHTNRVQANGGVAVSCQPEHIVRPPGLSHDPIRQSEGLRRL